MTTNGNKIEYNTVSNESRMSDAPYPTMLTGTSGTNKELVAKIVSPSVIFNALKARTLPSQGEGNTFSPGRRTSVMVTSATIVVRDASPRQEVKACVGRKLGIDLVVSLDGRTEDGIVE